MSMNIGYLAHFIVYVFAMSGVLLSAVFIYKKFCDIHSSSKDSRFLAVKDRISIAPRKNLYVIQAGSEYFLIAGDVERTTMLSKLNSDDSSKFSGENHQYSFNEEYKTDDIHLINKKIMQRLNERFKD